ncbi:MAG: hypothetical protein VKI83_04105 [Synechococcaceae cyanobacterium]|nr:hypothetical protein [Synechococcaceae cyanobacterium]
MDKAQRRQPDPPDLWDIDRLIDEVAQVRRALQLKADNLVLLGHGPGPAPRSPSALSRGSPMAMDNDQAASGTFTTSVDAGNRSEAQC